MSKTCLTNISLFYMYIDFMFAFPPSSIYHFVDEKHEKCRNAAPVIP